MKYTFFLSLFSLASLAVSAQSGAVKSQPSRPPFSLEAITPPAHFTGKGNYLLAFTDKDFNMKNYVFYTDSNATVAHLRINGNDVRLKGGHNPENIMTYVSKEYTVTLNTGKNPAGSKINETLVIYSRTQTVGKKVTGTLVNQ